MNFTFDASKTQTGATPGTNTSTTGGFAGAGDAGKPASTGFPLMSAPSQVKPGGLSFGLTGFGTPANTQSTGLTFGTPAAAATVPGMTFATPTTPALNFSATNPTTVTGFGAGNVQAAATSTGFSLGGVTPASTGSTGLSFGLPSATATSTGLSGSVGLTAASTAPPGFSIATTTATPQTGGTGFTLGGSTTVTTSTAFNTSTPIPSTGFSLGGPATTSATTGLTLGAGVPATSTTGFSLGKTTAAPVSTAVATTTPQTSLGTATTVSSSTSSQPGAINFCQLEESINKWTLELEEQEKAFVNQATQVNAWDKLLIANGEKISILNEEVERVKLEQQQLEHELDYVVGQQKELQDCLVPLEKELASLSVSDPERDYTYRLTESLHTQLNQMSEDLKEIIEHLNEANRTQDSSDPIVQIGKILNAHMNSLQWLDQRTSLLNQKIQQIEQMHQNFRQENERSFNLAYN